MGIFRQYIDIVDKALYISEQSDHKKFKIGAILLNKQGMVLSTGYNQYKTHPMMTRYNRMYCKEKIYLHAELAALIRNKHDDPHTLIVARRMRDGDFGLAKPCEICMAAILETTIRRIVYTDRNLDIKIIDI